MSEAQINAFNIASGNVEPTSLHPLFVGILIALLLLWSGWGLLHVYQGYASERITEQGLIRFVIRTVLLIVISLFLFAQ